jgi:hypothetical protein
VVSRWRLRGLVGCGAALFALTVLGLDIQRQGDTDGFVVVALGQGAVYLLATGLAWRGTRRHATVIVLGAALAMRVAVVLAPPHLSNDVYRYIWDGRVIAAGINPYRYIPADPQLAALRDPEIFPNINRSNYARTIYPPAAEAIFFLVTRISASPTAMKAAMVGFEAIAVGLLLGLLVASGQPASRIIVYAWHPLPLWEFAGSGHIDAAAVAFLAVALWTGRRAGGRLTGVALALGTLVKFYPAAIFPALWRRWDWRMPVAFAGGVVLAYLPFAGVGWRVLGFLPHYLDEEGFTGGGGFYLWNVANSVLPSGALTDLAYLAVAFCLLAALALYIAFRQRSLDGEFEGAALIAGACMLLLSPHYPWYFIWLIIFACLVPSAAFLWLTLASVLLYLVPVWPQVIWNRHRFIIESGLYVPFVLLAAADLWRVHCRGQAKHGERRTS